MRELERHPPSPITPRCAPRHVAIVGAGRLGTVLTAGLRTSRELQVDGPLRRGEPPARNADAVILCVPDAQIAHAAAAVPEAPLVGHCSGATGLSVLGPRRGFSLHPLMTVTRGTSASVLHGASAAIAGSDPAALASAHTLADLLGLTPIAIADGDRAAYHAAASIASNFLITLQAAAERLGATAGLPHDALVPLVRATVDNWAAAGARGALTGPVARGDELTVSRQRETVVHRAPELLALFDALTAATRVLASQPDAETVPC